MYIIKKHYVIADTPTSIYYTFIIFFEKLPFMSSDDCFLCTYKKTQKFHFLHHYTKNIVVIHYDK